MRKAHGKSVTLVYYFSSYFYPFYGIYIYSNIYNVFKLLELPVYMQVTMHLLDTLTKKKLKNKKVKSILAKFS